MQRDRNGQRYADVAIVGAGITGLAAAERLLELARDRGRGLRVVVLERAARAGGPILTEQVERVTIEAGPDQFVTGKPAALELCHRLGLADELVRFDVARAALQVVHRGRVVPLPAGLDFAGPARLLPLFASPLFSWRGKARLALARWRDGAGPESDESVAAFVERRCGRELHERVVEPIVGGIFTADTRRLSADVALARRTRAARASRGTSARTAGFATLRGGMGRLVERLVARLPSDCVTFGTPVERLRRASAEPGWLVAAGGREVAARAVVLAAPAPVCAALLRPLDAEIAARLERIEHASCATVSLLYPRAAVRRPLTGHGFFVPACSRLTLVACSHVSLKFPERAPDDRLLFRVFLGGARRPATLGADDAGLARLAHRSLVGLLDVRSEPELARVWRFPEAMPQYPVGFLDDQRAIASGLARHAGLVLAGSAAGAFGIPDCVASGERAAETAWEIAAAREGTALLPSIAG